MPAPHEAPQNAEARVARRGHAWVRRGGRIPNERWFVPDLAHLQRQVGMACIHRYRILHHPVVHHIEAGEERRTPRPAGSRLREVTAKCHTVGTERIQMWCPDTGMPQDTERITSPLVYYNQEHILLLTHGCSLYLLGLRESSHTFMVSRYLLGAVPDSSKASWPHG